MKNKFRKVVTGVLVFMLTLAPSPKARADVWGGDLIYLAQILANAVQQLAQLKQILSNGKDNLDLIREINRGINDSLQLYRTVFPDANPGLYKEWDKVQEAIRQIELVYGGVVPSPDSQIQKDADQSVAETVKLNNSIYDYTKEIDEIGEAIKTASHQVSPGGAQKLTAQALGVMLNVMNQSLRAQATGLKIQAQTLAIQNRKDKEFTRHLLASGTTLTNSMKNEPANFSIPRF